MAKITRCFGGFHLWPEARPRIISDNGPQFIAKDFKEFIRISGDDARSYLAVLPAIVAPAASFKRAYRTVALS